MLKDFINGKLLFCVGPEGYDGPMGVAGDAIDANDGENEEEEATATADAASGAPSARTGTPAGSSRAPRRVRGVAEGLSRTTRLRSSPAEMMDELGMGKQKAERPAREHKFQKKSKVKGRIKNKVRRGPARAAMGSGWVRRGDDARARAGHGQVRHHGRVKVAVGVIRR